MNLQPQQEKETPAMQAVDVNDTIRDLEEKVFQVHQRAARLVSLLKISELGAVNQVDGGDKNHQDIDWSAAFQALAELGNDIDNALLGVMDDLHKFPVLPANAA